MPKEPLYRTLSNNGHRYLVIFSSKFNNYALFQNSTTVYFMCLVFGRILNYNYESICDFRNKQFIVTKQCFCFYYFYFYISLVYISAYKN